MKEGIDEAELDAHFAVLAQVFIVLYCIGKRRNSWRKPRVNRTMQSNRIVLFCVVLYFIVLYCIVLYCIVLYRKTEKKCAKTTG